MKLLSFLVISAVAVANISLPATAQVPAKKIRTTIETQPPLSLTIYPTVETTINYGSAGETIDKIWLSELKHIGIDTHGCLEGLHPNCSVSNAKLLHIKLLDNTDKKTVGMTVITRDRQNRQKIYMYKLIPSFNSDGDGTYYYEYTPMQSSSIDANQAIAAKLVNRIQTGVKEGWIDVPIQSKAVKVAHLVNTEGKTIEEAANSADISSGFLNSILQG